MKNDEKYKEPVLLFTSSSLRLAAYAGWFSALGDAKQTNEYIHMAYAEWAKEAGLGRKYSLANRFNNDIYDKLDFKKLKSLTDKYLADLNKEIKKLKSR